VALRFGELNRFEKANQTLLPPTYNGEPFEHRYSDYQRSRTMGPAGQPNPAGYFRCRKSGTMRIPVRCRMQRGLAVCSGEYNRLGHRSQDPDPVRSGFSGFKRDAAGHPVSPHPSERMHGSVGQPDLADFSVYPRMCPEPAGIRFRFLAGPCHGIISDCPAEAFRKDFPLHSPSAVFHIGLYPQPDTADQTT